MFNVVESRATFCWFSCITIEAACLNLRLDEPLCGAMRSTRCFMQKYTQFTDKTAEYRSITACFITLLLRSQYT